MRNRALIAAVFVLAGLPLLAQDDRHQSYVTYDESDSVLVQNDGREVDVRVNLPVYPGDEVRAARRGRTELRLADGNVVALDRESVVKFESMLMNFEEAGEQTVVRLLSGHVVVYRRYEGSEPLRLDSSNASFVADRESIYGVESNSRGVDVVTVFEGSVEVRTPNGTTLLNAGDRAKIDPTGVYDRRAISNVAATEFERWFLARSERYANKESRHLDASLAYAEDDLNENGRWVYVKDYDQWAWRPYVSAGWRPYYYGYWGWGARGSSWISYEPWGWVPYHYGSWANVGHHGWIWFPGYVYAPAWVYWAWGPSWVGWVPWGYYSYYSGYYPWLYDRNCDPRIYGQYGFRGHVTVSSRDLGAYTIVDSRTLYSNRVDRAALTADAVRDRLAREGGRATFTNQPPRINRTDMKDPSTAVDRIIRGSRDGSGTGSVGAGSSGDLTQFFQRDPALPQDIRDRVTRGQSGTVAATTTTRGRNTFPSSSGGSAGATTTVPGRGGVRGGSLGGGTIGRPATTTGGSPTPTTGTIPRGGGTSTVPRGGGSTTGGTSSSGGGTVDKPATNRPGVGTTPRTQQPAETPTAPVPRGGTDSPTVDRSGSNGATNSSTGQWRGRPVRGSTTGGSSNTTSTPAPRTTVRDGSDNPVSRPSPPTTAPSSSSTRGSSGESWRGSGDTVRRVIGSIGGARLTPTGTRGSTSSGSKGSSGTSTRSGSSSSSKPSARSGSSSGSSSGSGSVSRPSSGSSSPSSSGSSRSSGSSS
ncbi:MAG: DUF6600 domain-containing protein [Thermoanaerobaculia bacterium]